MNQPFNDEELNKGFQMDTSLLTPEQLGHVENVFKARGIKVRGNSSPIWKCLEFYNKEGEVYVEYLPYFKEDGQLIDYPTLCRAAVQLELLDFTIMPDETSLQSLIDYGESICLHHYIQPRAHDSLYVLYGEVFGSTRLIIANAGGKPFKSISPEEFEQRLRGIYPVVRENRTTEKVETINNDMNGANIFVGGVKPDSDQVKNFRNSTETPKKYFKLKEESLNDFKQERLTDSPQMPIQPDALNDAKFTTEELVLAIGYGFKYCTESQNDGVDVPRGNKLQYALWLLEQRNTPVEPVYDAKWLDGIIKEYDDLLHLGSDNIHVGFQGKDETIYLKAKDSAPIILNALAKHLNNGKKGNEIIIQDCGVVEVHDLRDYDYGVPSFVDAEKAISILTNFPEVLPNYFKI